MGLCEVWSRASQPPRINNKPAKLHGEHSAIRSVRVCMVWDCLNEKTQFGCVAYCCLIEMRNPSWDRCGARAARPEKNLLGFCHAHPHVFLIYILEGTWLQGLAGCRCHCGVGGSVKCDCHIASPYPPPGFLEGAQWVRISAVVSNLRLKSPV